MPGAHPVHHHPRVRPSVLAGLILVGAAGAAWWLDRPTDVDGRFCPADAYLLEDGRSLHRDIDRGCTWVDQDGHPVPVDPSGRPLPGGSPAGAVAAP